MKSGLIVLPTYNESENITLMLNAIFSLSEEVHVLVVDDSSPDGTSTEVKVLQKKYKENLFLLERKEKRGLGTAYIAGFKWGLARSYDYFFQMDCDFSHSPSEIKDFIKLAEQAEIVIGSRFIKKDSLKE